MDNNRGNFLRGLAVAGGGFLAGRKAIARHHQPNEPVPAEAAQSEPRDLKVREEPFLPVHTRTFRSSRTSSITVSRSFISLRSQ